MAGSIFKNQPGPGAAGTGGGRDTPGAGKERGGFERDRARDRGTGKDRPPIYKPKDDGERNGYKGRITAKPGATNATKLAVTKFNVDNGHHQYVLGSY